MKMHLAPLPIDRARKIGSKTYVGPECKKGHYIHRNVSSRVCLVCKRENNREHMRRKYSDEDYRAQMHEKRRQRYAEDPEYRSRVLGQCRKYREQNAESTRRRAREYAEKNRDSASKRKRKWYEENKDWVFEYQRQYESENMEKCRAWKSASCKTRRLRRLAVKTELDQFVLEECYELAEKRSEEFGFAWHVDHMIPLQADTASGLHVWNNLQVIPAWLNHAKKNKMLYTEPMQWLSDATED